MTPTEVNAFWFGTPATSLPELGAKLSRWYQGGPTLDAEIVERFGALVNQAVEGELGSWEEDIDSRVALVLVLDQFTRSVFRDQARAFAGDPRAQRLAVDALDRGMFDSLGFVERMFMIMPLLHAENVPLLERAELELTRNVERAPAWAHKGLEAGVEQAKKYLGVVRKFGRFPHRNEALGRTSTPDEVEFLVDWKQRQPPQVVRELQAAKAAADPTG